MGVWSKSPVPTRILLTSRWPYIFSPTRVLPLWLVLLYGLFHVCPKDLRQRLFRTDSRFYTTKVNILVSYFLQWQNKKRKWIVVKFLRMFLNYIEILSYCFFSRVVSPSVHTFFVTVLCATSYHGHLYFDRSFI